jgi:hypothetical protein
VKTSLSLLQYPLLHGDKHLHYVSPSKKLGGTVVLKTTDILSPDVNAVPSNATTNDRSIYLTSRMSSVAILESTNSEA